MRKKATLLLGLLIIYICIILSIICYFYFQTIETNRQNKINLTSIQLHYAKSRLEFGQKKIEDNASTILVDEKVQELRKYEGDRESYSYLTMLLDIRSMLKERLINGENMSSISLFLTEQDILITTETNLSMRNELEKKLDGKKEWRQTDEGLYFFMNYTFGIDEKADLIVAIKMSDALLFETEAALSVMNNEKNSFSYVLFPNNKAVSGSMKLKKEIIQHIDQEKKGDFVRKSRIGAISGTLISEKSESSGIRLVTFLPRDKIEMKYNRNTLFVIISILVVLIFGLLLIVLFYRDILSEIRLLTNKFKSVEQGDYDTRISKVRNNEFNYLFEQFNLMISSIQKLLTSLNLEIKQRKLAEARQFRSQIQPHFLYNSLFYIVSVAHNPKAVTEMTRHLAEYYRYMTKKKDIVKIKDEIEFARHYLTIQSLRRDFNFQIMIDPEIEECFILPLIIQPIIENAIEHGIEGKDGANHVKVIGILKGDFCKIVIEDDGPGLNDQDIDELLKSISKHQRNENDSVGLWNVNQRLINYYGQQSKLRINRNKLGGLTVYFQFNLKGLMSGNETINR
ncbi:histidine kinase [Lederbergia sp. NSJ-179]|uniref:sensor histidine kinase n=1 Tax=Lederbergia sp. NSJ-179 TaxID=2931402 RepID=UPI001FD075FE|nr:histidine kinase [Lederbergia sp. NSJ-179]MCJ7842319.1 histidine kinase [Lederbergia sp. NSJ-179]